VTLGSSDIEASNRRDAIREKTLIWALRWGAFLCLIGWSWSHLYWEGPYGALLWNDTTYTIAQRFGVPWDEFVGDGMSAGLVQKGVRALGWLYVGCAVLCLALRARRWWTLALLMIGSGLLVAMSYAKFLQANRQLPMFVEHGGQMLAPTLLGLALFFGPRHRLTRSFALVGAIATFVGHGSYALGLWPTPANYQGMTSAILHLDTSSATIFLRTVGALDFLICIGFFFARVRRLCAVYAVIWGFLTAIARPVAGMGLELDRKSVV